MILILAVTLLSAAPASIVAIPSTSRAALVHHAVSTNDSAAQEAFDEGLSLVYAFNRDEARKRFERAAALDGSLAMAQWGIALAVGPNLNFDMTPGDLTIAAHALARAKELEASATPEERRYIDALAHRYPAAAGGNTDGPYRAYRDAMAALHAQFPADADAATLYAESVMDADDWGFRAGKPYGAETTILAGLHAALAIDANHVGANHYLVHALDWPDQAEAALGSARLLAALPAEPAASHLVHMAGHTFLDVGDFASIERSNAVAVADDEAYAASLHKEPSELDYYGHDLDFYGGSALMLGDWAVADDAAARFARAKNARALLIYAREHRWDAIAAWPEPTFDPKHASDTAVYRYARGLAALARGDVRAARSERGKLAVISPTNERTRTFVAVLGDLLDGRIAHAAGDDALALSRWHAFDVATADFPVEVFAPWYFPVAQWRATTLLRSGDLAGAESAFRAALHRTPGDARLLFGLSEVLGAQGRTADARPLAAEIVADWHGSIEQLRDVDI